jgi:hypothetical protein
VLGAAAVLLTVGVALALVRPGDLAQEDTAAPPAQETTSTETTEAPGTTAAPDSSAAPDVTEPAVAPADTTATTTPPPVPTTTAPTTTAPPTSVAGSGIGVSTPPTGGSDGIAETGGESMLGAGLALAAAGLVLRRVGVQTPARPTRRHT